MIEYGLGATILSVIIEEGITTIGDYAFSQSYKLKNATIPASVSTIENYAFHRCRSLTKIIVSPSNKEFSSDEQGALYNKDKTILIRAPMTKENFYIPDGVVTISRGCFSSQNLSPLGDIVIPNSVSILEAGSLNEGNFASITFDDNPSLISFESFVAHYSYSLIFMIPKSCTIIKERAISNSYISQLIFQSESTLQEIAQNAFLSTSGLYNLTLPDSLFRIGSSAFEGSKNLTFVSIGSSCSFIADTAFSRCPLIISFSVSKENMFYSSFQDFVMNDNQKTFIFFPPGKETISFPSTVTTVGETLLQSQETLTSIE